MIGRRTSLPRLGRGGPGRDRRLRAGQRRQRARLPDRAQRPVVEGQVGRDVQPGRARGWPRPTRSTTCWRWACGSTSTASRRQTGSTATMVFDPYFIVHHLSQFMVLEPGDLINTGTPPGVGMGFDPPVWLQPGDVMELGIDGLGTQRQHVIGAALTCAPSSSPGPASRTSRRFPTPVAGPGEVVVDVDRVGVCGTDVEFFTGEMEYLHDGPRARTRCASGTSGAAPSPPSAPACDAAWLGRRVTGDTHARLRTLPPLPSRAPARLRGPVRDRHPRRLPGALAEQLAVPARALLRAARRRRRRRRRDGRAGRQRPARRPGRRASSPASGCWSSGPAPSGCWPRGSPARRASEVHLLGVTGPVAGVRPGARLRAAPGRRRPARPPLGRRRRRLQRRGLPARARRSGRAGRPRRLHRPGREPSLLDTRDARAQGRHRGRHPQRLAGLAGRDRRVRRRARSTRGRSSPRPSASTTSHARARRPAPASAGPGPRSTSTHDARR